MQSTSWETLGWMKHKRNSRLLGETARGARQGAIGVVEAGQLSALCSGGSAELLESFSCWRPFPVYVSPSWTADNDTLLSQCNFVTARVLLWNVRGWKRHNKFPSLLSLRGPVSLAHSLLPYFKLPGRQSHKQRSKIFFKCLCWVLPLLKTHIT